MFSLTNTGMKQKRTKKDQVNDSVEIFIMVGCIFVISTIFALMFYWGI
jgi:hypothetical protein